MKLFFYKILLLLILFSSTASSTTSAAELSGNLSLQSRTFFNDPLNINQHDQYSSFAIEPELYQEWDSGQQMLNVAAFYRHDQYDEERTHGDIREFAWTGVYDNFEITAGISKVFWGVTETQHLVDIINQSDQVENTDGEDKLGQPMIRFSAERDWGILDFFILPGFRERTFAGIEGRPRAELPAGITFNADAATYESADKDNHIDYAVRWFSYFDEIEVGLSYFSGTSRDPIFNLSGSTLSPRYELIEQTGLELQALIDDWTWKLELISRKNNTEKYTALTGGFEYTLFGLLESASDLGIVIEYLYDDRGQLATTPFQNDITTALRLALNNAQSTEVLIGIINDLDDPIMVSFIEASQRIGDDFKLTLEARTFNKTIAGKPLHAFRQDNFIQADLAWYF